MKNKKHEKYMALAIELAYKGQGSTSPNPMVGAVIVKNNRIIGKGYHRSYGAHHAEVNAIRSTKESLSNSTIYITLEPCSHYGKTPPCLNFIIASGIKNVVVGSKDPNPKNIRHIKSLFNKAGISYTENILKDECDEINKGFFSVIKNKRPYVTLKLAQSLDGKIATKENDSKWITANKARQHVQRLRRENDAVMIGVNTVVADDPLLSVRNSHGPSKKQPVKIIVDSKLNIDKSAKIFSNISPGKSIIATSSKASTEKIGYFRKKGIQVIKGKDNQGYLNLVDILQKIAKLGINRVLVEGGGELAGNLYDKKIIDEICLFVAPVLIGGERAISSIRGSGITKIAKAAKIKSMKTAYFGHDLCIQGKVRY